MEERCIIDSFIVDVPVARRTLFNCAEGSVGVLKRTRAEKKKQKMIQVCIKQYCPSC